MIVVMSKLSLSLYEFLDIFPDHETARVFLENLRWSGVPCCPYCDSEENQHKQKRRGKLGYYFCYHCKKTYSVRTGTILQYSHIPLHKWLLAMYLFLESRKGISSVQLAKEVGITQKTAWFVLGRLRQACHTDDDVLLSGIIEVDEAFFGGKEGNKHESKKNHDGRGGKNKTLVLGMKERDGTTIATVITDTKAITIIPQIHTHISQKSTIITDQHPTYHNLDPRDYDHYCVNHSANEYVHDQAHINGIESFWALMKRGLIGIYHKFSVKHLQRYINEFTFRIHEGNTKTHIIHIITKLLKKTFTTPHLSYHQLTN